MGGRKGGKEGGREKEREGGSEEEREGKREGGGTGRRGAAGSPGRPARPAPPGTATSWCCPAPSEAQGRAGGRRTGSRRKVAGTEELQECAALRHGK